MNCNVHWQMRQLQFCRDQEVESRGKVIVPQPVVKEVIESASQDGSYSIEFTAEDDDYEMTNVQSCEGAEQEEESLSSSGKGSSAAKSIYQEIGSKEPVTIPLVSKVEDLSTIVWSPMPNQLKDILDADQERIVTEKNLYQLPMEIPIFDILQSFIDAAMNGNPAELFPNLNKRSGMTRSTAQTTSRCYQDLQQLVAEFANSIDIYVNAIAITHLFYNQEEKEHFIQSSHPADNNLGDNCRELKPTEVLGFVHLLRFLVLLPDFIKSTPTMTKSHVHQIMSITDPFYQFLINKINDFHLI